MFHTLTIEPIERTKRNRTNQIKYVLSTLRGLIFANAKNFTVSQFYNSSNSKIFPSFSKSLSLWPSSFFFGSLENPPFDILVSLDPLSNAITSLLTNLFQSQHKGCEEGWGFFGFNYVHYFVQNTSFFIQPEGIVPFKRTLFSFRSVRN